VGLAPARVAQRPWLPQHARHCPVLEAGSALGCLVYPPLAATEAFQVSYTGSRYELTYFGEAATDRWETVFRLGFTMPGAGAGSFVQELAVSDGHPELSEGEVMHIRDALLFPHHFGVPAGGVGLRGTVDFRTPAGWDTVYGPVANHLQPPVLGAMTVRVETDWYAHDTEIRYVLQPGDVLHVAAGTPIGQVFFVPREEIALRAAHPDEAAAFGREKEEFDRAKAAVRTTTPYGLPHSPHYQKMRREHGR
jgi:hypothetical protein